MLKTISAALVAVSVLAAPALAGTPGKTAQAPVNKTAQAPRKGGAGQSKVLNASAGWTAITSIIASSPPQAHRLAQAHAKHMRSST